MSISDTLVLQVCRTRKVFSTVAYCSAVETRDLWRTSENIRRRRYNPPHIMTRPHHVKLKVKDCVWCMFHVLLTRE